jgi:polyphosphate glucokinase
MDEKLAVLAVDVGGSHVKVLASGETEHRRVRSGPAFTPTEMVEAAVEAAAGWHWEVVTVGVPAPVQRGSVITEPFNLGRGWVGFDFEAAFGVPTKVMNDAAMQALGSYASGTMLFLGLGTGLGSALIVDGTIVPMEIAHLPFKELTFEDYLGDRGRKRVGNKRWQQTVIDAVERLIAAFEPDTVVIGGGNATKLEELPPRASLGSNRNAFKGGFRAWSSPAAQPDSS